MSKGEQPAYPVKSAAEYQAHGLTKREYFTGLAMQAIISGTLSNSDAMRASSILATESGKDDYTYLVSHAVRYADAALTELEKTA